MQRRHARVALDRLRLHRRRANAMRRREVPYRLAHEYPEQPDIRQASLLAAIQAARDLVSAYEAWRARLRAARVGAS